MGRRTVSLLLPPASSFVIFELSVVVVPKHVVLIIPYITILHYVDGVCLYVCGVNNGEMGVVLSAQDIVTRIDHKTHVMLNP